MRDVFASLSNFSSSRRDAGQSFGPASSRVRLRGRQRRAPPFRHADVSRGVLAATIASTSRRSSANDARVSCDCLNGVGGGRRLRRERLVFAANRNLGHRQETRAIQFVVESLRVRVLVFERAVERRQRPFALRHRSLDDGGGFVGDSRAFGVGVSRLSRPRLQRLLERLRARHHARDGGGVLWIRRSRALSRVPNRIRPIEEFSHASARESFDSIVASSRRVASASRTAARHAARCSSTRRASESRSRSSSISASTSLLRHDRAARGLRSQPRGCALKQRVPGCPRGGARRARGVRSCASSPPRRTRRVSPPRRFVPSRRGEVLARRAASSASRSLAR